jgi:peptidyl-prolyl cis-trans isomerase D
MLAQLRRNTKIILWVVIVAFVGLMFFVWGMNLRRSGGVEAGVVGRIGDTRITVDQYRNEVANQRAAYYQEKGNRRDAQAEVEINQRAWDAIVQNHLLIKEVNKENLAVSDDEVMMEMQANPPAFIRSQPVFQTDSTFDHTKYLAALSDPQYDFRPLEAYIRATLPLVKLQNYIAAGVRVTDDEARLMLSMLDEKATISYVKASPLVDVKEVNPQVSETELNSYYSSHGDEFKVPETRKFRYVQFPKQPSGEDAQYAKDRIDEARVATLAEIEGGPADVATVDKAFSEMASEYSDDEMTARQGGDLGWIKRGQLRGALDSVAFNLDVGRVSDVISTEGSYHLLLVVEKRSAGGVEDVKVRHIMARIEMSPSTLDQIRNEAADFAQMAAGKGLDKASKERDLKSLDSPALTEPQMVSFFRIPAAAAETIFKKGKMEASHAAEGSQAFLVMEVTEVVPERTPPFEEIKDRVRQAYVMNIRKEKAREMASGVAQGVAQGKTLETAAAPWNLQVVRTQPFTLTSNVPGIGKDNAVIARAFTLVPGQTTGVVESAGEFFVIRLESLTEPDLAALGGSFGQLKQSLLTTKQQAFVTDWYTNLLSQAKIQDDRSSEGGGTATKGKRPSSSYLYTGY